MDGYCGGKILGGDQNWDQLMPQQIPQNESEGNPDEGEPVSLPENDAPDLPFYTDKDGKLAAAFGVFTSPHTVLFNKKGQEIGRIRGSAEWNDPRVIEYIYKLKAENN